MKIYTNELGHMTNMAAKPIYGKNLKQEGHEALNRSPEYTGQSQTFNFEI